MNRYLTRTVAALATAALLGAAVPALAGTAGQDPPVARSSRDDGRRTTGRFAVNFLRGTAGVFSPDNIKPILIGGAASGLGSLFDENIAEAIANPDQDFGRSFEYGAEPAAIGAVVAALLATGRVSDRPRYRAMTYDWMHAFLINAGYTVLLKEVVRRERPDGSDELSFPSGHASNAFALAAVAERHYGWKAGVPAYTIAGLVAVSRMQRNKHYLSDVMAGATLGYIVGRTVARINGQRLVSTPGTQFSLSPVLSRRTSGLAASVSF